MANGDDYEPEDFQEAFREAFEDLIGTREETETYNGGITGNADDWIELFSETGIVTDDIETDVEAFQEFLIAFFPQDKSPDDWYYDRQEFYDTYGISSSDIDWEYYREIVITPLWDTQQRLTATGMYAIQGERNSPEYMVALRDTGSISIITTLYQMMIHAVAGQQSPNTSEHESRGNVKKPRCLAPMIERHKGDLNPVCWRPENHNGPHISRGAYLRDIKRRKMKRYRTTP